jgi:hypothetical protein
MLLSLPCETNSLLTASQLVTDADHRHEEAMLRGGPPTSALDKTIAHYAAWNQVSRSDGV